MAFTGDGSLSMGMGELATLAYYQLPITVVVLHNDSLALEVWEQNALLANPQFACDLPSVGFAGVAENCGLRAWRVDDPGEVPDVLCKALDHDGPTLVEAMVDPHEAPCGETLLPGQAAKIASAYEQGERDRTPMAGNLLESQRVALSRAVRSV